MALILGFISIVAFIAYFYAIGLWYVGLVPLLVFVVGLIYYISGISFKAKGKNILQKYGLFLAWVVVMIGFLGILKFFGISVLNSVLFITVLNILLRFASYMFSYDDGKDIAQVGYYLSMFIFLGYVWIIYDFYTFFIVFSMVWALSLAINAFVVFILGIRFQIAKYLGYVLFAFVLGAVGLIFYYQIANIYVFLLVAVICLGVLYMYIYHVLSHKPPSDHEIKEISVRRILAGERVLKQKTQDRIWASKVYTFVDSIPTALKYFLEGSNIFVILLLIYLYFQNALTLQGSVEQIFYRLITVGFIINVFLLKKINYTSVLQRFLTFIVINFAIYISLFSAFHLNISKIVLWGIIRNILAALMVFHIHKTSIGIYLKKVDYLFWIFTTILALIVNIVLLFHAQIHSQLLFPIILLYLGVQGMILFYSIKYVDKIQEIKLD